MSWPPSYRARLVIRTTSDWTTLNVVSGGAWVETELVSASPSALTAGLESGDRFVLTQSLDDANAGKQVEMIWDISFTGLASGQDLVLQIDRGNLGRTQVAILGYPSETPVELKTFEWDQITSGRNSHQITLPSDLLITQEP